MPRRNHSRRQNSKKQSSKKISLTAYSEAALPHLAGLVAPNLPAMRKIAQRLVKDVQGGKNLLVFGSGHSALFPLELYHRAGGASFVLPLIADYLLPSAGPGMVRVLERTAGVANPLLERAQAQPGEMLWLCSQSGINAAGVDLALEAKRLGLYTVAFTSRAHSQSQTSRHASGKRLFEVTDEVIDLGGQAGDALVELSPAVRVGPVSSLGFILLGHSILAHVCAELEAQGHRCVYTSVNTAQGESRNRAIEKKQAKRDPLLR